MLAHFSAIVVVKVHTVTTFPTREALLSAYVPKLFCSLPIGQLADTSREYIFSLDLMLASRFW